MSENSKKLPPWARLALDYGPLVVFFVVLNLKDIYTATACFMPVIALAAVIEFVRESRISPMLGINAVLVLVLGGLTLYFHDKTFIKIKPTIVYTVFAVMLGGGVATGRNFLKLLFEQSFHLSDVHWRMLTIRWCMFFVVLAILNEIIWRNFSDKIWGDFKLFGFVPLIFLFALAQTPFILKHHIEDEKPSS